MNWRAGIKKQEAELVEYYASFPWRSLAINRLVEDMIARWRANPPGPPRPGPRLNDGEDYTLQRFPGETFRNGMRSPGE
jgi:hypothetical protein